MRFDKSPIPSLEGRSGKAQPWVVEFEQQTFSGGLAAALTVARGSRRAQMGHMAAIRDFHAHIYFDARQVEEAKALARAAHERFGVPVGHFHLGPVGPHPRGSCQLTVLPEQFGEFAQWAVLSRNGLTIFAHAETGDDLADHTDHVIWFGPSEPLDLSIFG